MDITPNTKKALQQAYKEARGYGFTALLFAAVAETRISNIHVWTGHRRSTAATVWPSEDDAQKIITWLKKWRSALILKEFEFNEYMALANACIRRTSSRRTEGWRIVAAHIHPSLKNKAIPKETAEFILFNLLKAKHDMLTKYYMICGLHDITPPAPTTVVNPWPNITFGDA